MLNGEGQRGAPSPVDSEPTILGDPPPPPPLPPRQEDDRPATVGEVRRVMDSVYANMRRMVEGIMSKAIPRAIAEARKTFDQERAELIAKHEAEKQALIVEVAQATRDAMRAAQKGK